MGFWLEIQRRINHRRVSLEGTTVGDLVPPPCSSRAIPERITRNSDDSRVSPARETPQRLWAIYSSVQSLHRKQAFPDIQVALPVHQLPPVAETLSYCWAPAGSARTPPLGTSPLESDRHRLGSLPYPLHIHPKQPGLQVSVCFVRTHIQTNRV